MRRLALAGLLMLAGCADAAPPHLAPIPPPAAVIVKVPQFVALPKQATDPCAEPGARQIRTDVQLLEAADAWKTTARCNANKLRAIEAAQP